ncbi:MAG: hypothetical protein ACI9MR_000354 [Myxococcota bacterium]|jgi:hypothetical protein
MSIHIPRILATLALTSVVTQVYAAEPAPAYVDRFEERPTAVHLELGFGLPTGSFGATVEHAPSDHLVLRAGAGVSPRGDVQGALGLGGRIKLRGKLAFGLMGVYSLGEYETFGICLFSNCGAGDRAFTHWFSLLGQFNLRITWGFSFHVQLGYSRAIVTESQISEGDRNLFVLGAGPGWAF